ncbi:MAG TPA: hypothetical protein VIX17_16325 [Pyrinomonadaceae bacterium]
MKSLKKIAVAAGRYHLAVAGGYAVYFAGDLKTAYPPATAGWY